MTLKKITLLTNSGQQTLVYANNLSTYINFIRCTLRFRNFYSYFHVAFYFCYLLTAVVEQCNVRTVCFFMLSFNFCVFLAHPRGF